MPRERTRTAIRKSKRNEEQKADARSMSLQQASRKYRRKRKESYNESAKLRMRRTRASNSAEQSQKTEQRRESAQKYYLKNREKILRRADSKRVKAFVAKHDGAEWAYFAYPTRRYKLRLGHAAEVQELEHTM
ncbi:hypothetical protein EV360DRAFT_86152 [Lentinula raphanica]|nr:hypothetical protein EV360DRAFT_86152 [Lentinula raphanica]